MAGAVINRIFNFDVAVLRGLAISAVLLYHFFPGHFPWGFVGVDTFFVISGYLVASILCSGERGIADFYLARVKRIFPALLLLLALVTLAGYLLLLDDEFSLLLKEGIYSLFQVQNWYQMSRSGYFADAVNFRPLLHLWSLSVEFQFYLFLPLAFYFARRRGYSELKAVILLLGLSLLAGVVCGPLMGKDTFFWSPVRIWQLLAGSVCFMIEARLVARPGFRLFFALTAAASVVALVLFVRPEATYPGVSGLLPVIGSVAFILARPAAAMPRDLLQPLVYVAGISYSLYLFHFPALEFIRQTYGSPTILQRLGVLGATFLIAHWVDRKAVPRITALPHTNGVIGLASFTLLLAFAAQLALFPSDRGPMRLNPPELTTGTFVVDYKESCTGLTRQQHPQDRCRKLSAAADHPQYVLLGDSLANSFTTVFDSLVRTDPRFGAYVQFGRGKCPLIAGAGDRECDRFAGLVRERLATGYSGVPVLLVGQWPLYFTGKDNEHDRKFIEGMDELLDTLSRSGRKVYFVHSVPLGALPRTCLARLHGTRPGECDIPLQLAATRENGYRKAFSPVLAKRGVIEFDPGQWLCDGQWCAVFHRGSVLYLDDSHLSRQGGSELAARSLGWWMANATFDK